MGITAGLGAAASIEGGIDAIESFKDGTSSASEMVTSLAGSVGNLATQGALAFTSMRAGVESFAKALGKAGAAAGPIGLALTAFTIALPFIIKGIDSLFETEEEKIERLNNNVENA